MEAVSTQWAVNLSEGTGHTSELIIITVERPAHFVCALDSFLFCNSKIVVSQTVYKNTFEIYIQHLNNLWVDAKKCKHSAVPRVLFLSSKFISLMRGSRANLQVTGFWKKTDWPTCQYHCQFLIGSVKDIVKIIFAMEY